MSNANIKSAQFLQCSDSQCSELQYPELQCHDVVNVDANFIINENASIDSNKASPLSWQVLASCSQQSARNIVPFSIAQKHSVLPLSILCNQKSSDVLVLTISKEPDANLIKLLRFVSQMDIVWEVVDENLVRKAIYAAYEGSQDKCASSLVAANIEMASQKGDISSFNNLNQISANVDDSKILNAPVPQLLNAIIDRALFRNATDIHIEPRVTQYVVRFRIDGILQHDTVFDMPFEVANALLRRIRILCQLDISQHDTPQEGSFSYERDTWRVRIRVSALPLVKGHKIELRLLDNSFLEESLLNKNCVECLSASNTELLQVLGLDSSQIGLLDAFLAQSSGVILAVGPTGSGKSTLLYAALERCNDGTKSIITIEDPVERIISGVNQIAVKDVVGMRHSDLLKASLRQDPDVIMVGEIRDKDTACVALTAGGTGHLVLSTLHSSFCIEAFDRLLHLGVNPGLIASSLRLVVAQRLLPKNCNVCKRNFPESEKVARLLNIKLNNTKSDAMFMFSSGCQACHNTGIAGRIGVFEFMPVHEGLRAMLMGHSGYLNIRQQEHARSSFNFGRRVCDLMIQGVVSPIFALQALGISAKCIRS